MMTRHSNPALPTREREMPVWTGTALATPPIAGAVAALGNLDGLHRGHKALVARAAAEAQRIGIPAIIATFEPHPRQFFQPDAPHFRLSSRGLRNDMAAALGVSGVAEIPFDRAMAGLTPREFVEKVLVGQLALKGVVVGEDFAFGRGRSGSFADLSSLMLESGGEAFALPPVRDEAGVVVSSSRIRAALREGDIQQANRLLGHRWTTRGKVTHGDKRGRLLGFPTANMTLPPGCGLRHGIYAVEARINDEWRRGAASFGRRPTFDDGAPRLETYVFDFSGDLYDRIIDIAFVGWVRGEERFESVEALVERMRADCEIAARMER